MNKNDIIREYNLFINKFKLKPEEFIIGAGGACVMHGVRQETNDMDMAVPISFFNKLLKTNKYKTHTFTGWFDTLQTSLEYNDNIDLHIGDVKSPNIVIINGVCSYSLETLLEQKLKMNRPKDQNDIKIIKELIKKNNNISKENMFTHSFMNW